MRVLGNRAVSFSLAYRAWQGMAGLLTIPLVVHFLRPDTQGYYYTFASLVALQSFFELGLSIVISVFASHEWHRLVRDESGAITGDADSLSRLASLARFVFAYFGFASLGFLFIAGTIGFYVLNKGDANTVNWIFPWILQISLASLILWLMPLLSLLEGCNQMARVARFRLAQSVISNAALWLSLAAGLQLWALPIYSGMMLLMLLGFLAIRERSYFSQVLRAPTGERLSWKKDLLPMQWRLAIQGLFSYLSFPLFTIIVYLHGGSIEAGRMGMTLQILTGIQSFALVFLLARAPEFALLAASGAREELVARCRKAALRSVGVMAACCLLVLLTLSLAQAMGVTQAGRVLSGASFATFAAGVVLTAPVQAIAVYLRAHKKELLTVVGVLGGLLYGSTAWLSGVRYGSTGIAVSYLAVTGLVVLPLTWRVLRANRERLR
jgi:hypothetical protein